MTTLTLSPTSWVREALSQSPALQLPKEQPGRAGLARRFLLALLRSLAAPAA